MLPPRMAHSKIYGQLSIKISRPRWNVVANSCRVKIRFWGQQQPTGIILSEQTNIQYDVVVPLDRLQSYLVDMKVLKLDFEDYRNGKVLATGIVNFLMYPMERDRLDIKECVQLHYLKKKCGEVGINLQFKTNDNQVKSQIKEILLNKGELMETEKKQQKQIPKQDSISSMVDKYTRINKECICPKRPKCPPLRYPLDQQLVNILNQHCCQRTTYLRRQNFQAEIQKLRLDQLELFDAVPTTSASETMNILIDYCQKTNNQSTDYRLTVEIPILINGNVRLNMYDIACKTCRNSRIDFGQMIQLNLAEGQRDDKVFRKYLLESAKFQLFQKTNDLKMVGEATIKLSALIAGIASGLVSMNMKNRKGARGDYTLFLKKGDRVHKQIKEEQPRREEVPQTQKTTKTPTVLSHPMNLFLQINSYHNLQPTLFRDNNYMLRIKFNNKSYSSPTYWSSHSPTFCFNVLLPASEPTPILIQLWNRSSNDSLIGICKIDVPQLKQTASLYPTVLFDDQFQVNSLKSVVMGYLNIVLLAGDPQQINRYNGRHRQKSIISDKQSNINQETAINERQDNNRDIQHEQKQRPIERPKQPQKQPEIPKQPQPQDSIPSIRQIEPHQPQQPKSIFQLLYHFFNSFIKSSKQHILKSLGPSMPIIQFRDLIHQHYPLSQLSLGKISYFFVDNVRINTQQVIKSFQAFENYQGILSEQFTQVLREMKQAMNYEGLSVNMLQIKLSLDSHEISATTFKNILEVELPAFSKISQQVICRMLQPPINVGEFCDYIRKLDLFQQVTALNTGPRPMLEFIGEEFKSIAENQQGGLAKVYTCQTLPSTMDHKQVVKAFLVADINISYWEALNILQYIGDDSRQAFVEWIGEMLVDPPTKMMRSPTFGQATFRPQLREVSQVIDSSLPSPIHAPAVKVQFNMGLSASNLLINGKSVAFRQISECVLEIKTRVEEYYEAEVDTEDGTLFGQGLPGQWVAVMDQQQNYIGAMIIK